jgi:protein-S-isoprenylcysteine O-methyltransferase Ste14
MKLRVYIDSNKGITFLVLLGLIAYYRQWDNPTAMIYLALHGTYGLLWVMKSRIFPDKRWDEKVPLWFGLAAWFGLALYWFPGWLIVSRPVSSPAWLLALCISIYTLGVFFHFTSDMQKHVSLETRPKTLITDRLFRLSRNINYFGELLLYAAMAGLAMSWLAFIPLAAFVLFYWIPGMIRKERSLARYPGFNEYREHVRFLIPFLI